MVRVIKLKPTAANRAFIADQRARKRGRRGPRTKSTVALIKKVLNRSLETKYASVANAQAVNGYTVSGSIIPANDFHVMLPTVPQQTTTATSNTREGDCIEPIKARITGHVFFAPQFEQDSNLVVFVKLYFVQAKAVKDLTACSTSLPLGLLETGAADPQFWGSPQGSVQAFYPVCKDNYTVMSTKTVKLSKNQGVPVGTQATANATNLGMDRIPFSYTWTPPKLKYGVDADVYPQNHAPVMFAVAYCPGFDFDANQSLHNSVRMNWNVDMWYKDA